jgi:hypothetical protein
MHGQRGGVHQSRKHLRRPSTARDSDDRFSAGIGRLIISVFHSTWANSKFSVQAWTRITELSIPVNHYINFYRHVCDMQVLLAQILIVCSVVQISGVAGPGSQNAALKTTSLRSLSNMGVIF